MSAVFSTISGFFIPAIIIFILSYGLYKKTPLYDVFIDGAKDGLKTVVEIIPFILAVFVGITALTSSGVMDWLQKISAPLFNIIKIPEADFPDSASLGIGKRLPCCGAEHNAGLRH